eukprot:365542-Chlamydomonas_euryale.AAC.32
MEQRLDDYADSLPFTKLAERAWRQPPCCCICLLALCQESKQVTAVGIFQDKHHAILLQGNVHAHALGLTGIQAYKAFFRTDKRLPAARPTT